MGGGNGTSAFLPSLFPPAEITNRLLHASLVPKGKERKVTHMDPHPKGLFLLHFRLLLPRPCSRSSSWASTSPSWLRGSRPPSTWPARRRRPAGGGSRGERPARSTGGPPGRPPRTGHTGRTAGGRPGRSPPRRRSSCSCCCCCCRWPRVPGRAPRASDRGPCPPGARRGGGEGRRNSGEIKRVGLMLLLVVVTAAAVIIAVTRVNLAKCWCPNFCYSGAILQPTLSFPNL